METHFRNSFTVDKKLMLKSTSQLTLLNHLSLMSGVNVSISLLKHEDAKLYVDSEFVSTIVGDRGAELLYKTWHFSVDNILSLWKIIHSYKSLYKFLKALALVQLLNSLCL